MSVKFFDTHTHKKLYPVSFLFGLHHPASQLNVGLKRLALAGARRPGSSVPARARPPARRRQPQLLGQPQTCRGGPGLRHKGRPAPRARVPSCQAPSRPSLVSTAARGGGEEGRPSQSAIPLPQPRVRSPPGRAPHSRTPRPGLTSSSLSLRKHRHAALFL